MIHLKKSVADSIGRDDGGWNKQKDDEKKNDLPEEEEDEETAWRRRKWYVRVGSPDQKKKPLDRVNPNKCFFFYVVNQHMNVEGQPSKWLFPSLRIVEPI